jgi:hypothetical protein
MLAGAITDSPEQLVVYGAALFAFPPMFHRLFTILSAVSLLCLAAGGGLLLLYPPPRPNPVEFSFGGVRWELHFRREEVEVDNDPQRRLDRDRDPAFAQARQAWEKADAAHKAACRRFVQLPEMTPAERKREEQTVINTADAFNSTWGDYQQSLSLRSPAVSYSVYYSLLAAAAALLPLAWLMVQADIRLQRRRLRQMSGLCPTCGYDLRATPDRCPECGVVPA